MNGDLISRSALVENIAFLENGGYGGKAVEAIKRYIKRAPAVDAVEVVRCKDCKRNPGYKPNGRNMVWCRRWRDYTPLNGFCGYGERRADK